MQESGLFNYMSIKKGQHLSPATEWKKGCENKGYWLGKKRPPFSEETRKKMIKNHHNVSRENNPNWKGGYARELYPKEWKKLRYKIRERDNHICQICKKYGKVIHHIDYNKNNCDPKNLITLCFVCHTKTNFNRPYWINYFSLAQRDK